MMEGGLSALCESCARPIAPSTAPTLLEAAAAIVKALDELMPQNHRGLTIPWELLAPLQRAVETAKAAKPGRRIWVVIDEDDLPVYPTTDKQIANDHINNAISKHRIKEAGRWLVREFEEVKR